MLLMAANLALFLSREAAGRFHDRQVFDKLVSIADFTVKSGAIVRNGSVRYPNWLSEGNLTDDYSEGLRQEAGLSSLSISLGAPDDKGGVCIYRVVAVGDSKAIQRLFVCGG
jgi:hypothetical protein